MKTYTYAEGYLDAYVAKIRNIEWENRVEQIEKLTVERLCDRVSDQEDVIKVLNQRLAELEEDNQRLQDTIKAQISTIFDAKAEADRLSRILEAQTQTIVRQQKAIESIT